MSKLSKFKPHISPAEAAELLSSLINEKVSAEDLKYLHKLGWLTANYSCLGTVVKLKHEFADEIKDIPSISKLHLMTEDRDIGLCFSLDLPLCEIVINQTERSYVLMDDENNFYAIRDNDNNQYISDTNDNLSSFAESGLYPHEIYELAELANNNLPADPPDIKILKNNHCLAEVDLYNFAPESGQKLSEVLSTERLPQSEPPSYVLAVAALVEILINGRTKNHNQSSLIDEILEKYDLRGLSKSNLEKIFSQANRKLTEAMAARA